MYLLLNILTDFYVRAFWYNDNYSAYELLAANIYNVIYTLGQNHDSA